MADHRLPDHLLAEIRARLPLSSLVGRHVPLKRAGRIHKGLCPFHGERTPSFVVDDARQSFHCFGCGAHGDAFGWLMRREGRTFPEAAQALALEAGVSLPDRPRAARLAPPAPPPAPPAPRELDDAELRDIAARRERAREIWLGAGPIQEQGAVAAYLRRRHLWPLPESAHAVLRQGWLRHPETRQAHPAMVARVDGPDGQPCAVHRTFLRDDGHKLDGAAKLTLGAIAAAAIRLHPPAVRQGFAEGIETALAAWALHGVPCWACISAGELARQSPPFDVEEAVIFADNDPPKGGHPEGAGLRAARTLEAALRRQGVRASIRIPRAPWGDYADVLAAREEGA